MRFAMQETARRREKQLAYNKEHGITPTTIIKEIRDILGSVYELDYAHIPDGAEPEPARLTGKAKKARIEELRRLMFEAAADLRFEDAAAHRDEICKLGGKTE